MTTPVLPTGLATVPAAAAPAGAPAEEGVFAGLLAGAVTLETAPVDLGALADLALAPALDEETAVDPAGLLSAQALGLVPLSLLPPPVVEQAAAGPPETPEVTGVTGPAAGSSPVATAAPSAVPTAAAPQATASAAPAVPAAAAPAAAAVPAPVAPAPPTPAPDAASTERTPAATPLPAAAVPVATPIATPAADTAVGAAPPSSPAPASPDAVPGEARPAAESAVRTGPAPLEQLPLDQAPLDQVPLQQAPLEQGPAEAAQGVAPTTAPGAAPVTPPAPAAPLAVAAERAPEQVQPAVGELARGLKDVGGGRASLVVRLDPPELGPVLVRLTVRDGVVDVQLRATEAVAASGLLLATADVRSTLAEHGLDLSSFDVQHGDLPEPGPRGGSPDQGTPRRGQGADRTAGASGAGTGLTGVTTETTADGSPAGTWL